MSPRQPRAMHHRVVVIGGGSAGITVAARLRRSGVDDVALVEPSDTHYYQPLWTLVGGGAAPAHITARRESRVVPPGTRWIQDHATEIDPDRHLVRTRSGARLSYDVLVVAAGIQLDWDAIAGLPAALGRDGVTSNYRFDLAPKTWEFLQRLRGGTAVFAGAEGPVKCGGAAQKAVYLSSDYLRRHGRLEAVDVIFGTPGDGIFGIPEFAAVLERVIARYGIDVRYHHELVEVRPQTREAVFAVGDPAGATRDTTVVPYDFLHVVPPQSAPDFLKQSPLAVPNDPKGWVDVDDETLRHLRYPEIFALGDASGAPNAKTGAAVRKQAPVVVENLCAVLAGREPEARYDGYSSCPIVTGYGRLVLAEFDYSGRPHPTIPFIDTARERYDMWLLKRYGLPFMYWNLMLKGLA